MVKGEGGDQLKNKDESGRGKKRRGGMRGWSRNEDQGQPERWRKSGTRDLFVLAIDLRALGSCTG